MEDYMTRTLPASTRTQMRPQPASGFKPPHPSSTASSSMTSSLSFSHQQQTVHKTTSNHPPPQLNPPSYYSTFHEQPTHHFYYTQQPQRPRPQYFNNQPPTQQQYHQTSSPVKFYRQTPSQINYKVASVLHNGHHHQQPPPPAPPPSVSSVVISSTAPSSASSSSTGSPSNGIVTMRRPPASTRTTATTATNSSSSNRRNAVYVKEVTPEATKSKPPLPSEVTNQVPKPPPRSRPKSWTSTLFNAMRNNHRSVTFQCVDEEEQNNRISTNEIISPSEVIVASDPTMPLAAASSSEGQKFYSLPRPNQGTRLGVTRSRTPSPFRSMIKGLVKGKNYAPQSISYFQYRAHPSHMGKHAAVCVFIRLLLNPSIAVVEAQKT